MTPRPGCSFCAECGRGCFAPSVEGWCARCDMLVTAQARVGIERLCEYLAKVAAFEAWDRDYRRMAA